MKDEFKHKIIAFKFSVGDLRDKMQKLLKMCDSTDFKQNEAFDTLQDGLINLMEIKHSNSDIQKEIESFKEFTTKEKEKVEERNLNYQNYSYQKENLISQINACVNYPTVEIDKIEMPTDEEVVNFYSKGNGFMFDETENKTMNILKCELEMRKELDEKVKSLSEVKDENAETLKEKEKFIKELPKYFTDLEANSLKAQKFLNLNITESQNNITLSEKLPSSLYVLYNSLVSLDQNFKCEVKIMGKVHEMEEYNQNYTTDNFNFIDDSDEIKTNAREEGEHSDDGEIQEQDQIDKIEDQETSYTKLRITRKKNRKLNENNGIWKLNTFKIDKNLELPKITKCPMYVQFVIYSIMACENSPTNNHDNTNENKIFPLMINFYFIPVFNVITAEVVSKNNDFNTNNLLSNIFMPPSNLLSEMKDEINSAITYLCQDCSVNEKFLDYAQYLCYNYNYNLSYLKKLSKLILKKKNRRSTSEVEYFLDDPHKITVDNFLLNLKQRLLSLPVLFNQLENLSYNRKISTEILKEINKDMRLNLTKRKVSLSEFSKINQEEYLKALRHTINLDDDVTNSSVLCVYEKDEQGNYLKKYVKVPVTIYDSEEALYYKIVFEAKTIRVIAFVEIGFDYPFNNPKFILVEDNTNKSPLLTMIPENLKHLVKEESKNIENTITGLNNHLQEIQREVNHYFFELCSESNQQYLLSYQIKYVQIALEILDHLKTAQNTTVNLKKRRPFNLNDLNKYIIN